MGILYFDRRELFGENGFQKIMGEKLEMWTPYEMSSKELMQLCKTSKESTRRDIFDSTTIPIISAPLFVNERHDGFYVLFDGKNEYIPWTPTNSDRWFYDNDMVINSDNYLIKVMELNMLKFMFTKCTRAGLDSFRCIDPNDNFDTQLEKLGIFVNIPDFDDKYIIIYHEHWNANFGMLFVFKVIPIIDDSAFYPMFQITIDDLQKIYNSGVLDRDDRCIHLPIEERFEFALADDYIEKCGTYRDDLPIEESISYWDSLIVPLTKSSIIKGSLRLK